MDRNKRFTIPDRRSTAVKVATLDIIGPKKNKTGTVTLADTLLSEKVNKAVLHQSLIRILAGAHHGTVDTKTRAEVHRTGKKVFKQKGTGNARHGSRKSAPFVGGGRIFGPHQRDFSIVMNKKARRLALREALRSCVIDGKVTIVESIPLTRIKTKEALHFFDSLGIPGGLVVIEEASDFIEKSLRNSSEFEIVNPDQINVHNLLKHPRVIFTTKSFELIQQRYLAA